MASTRTQEEITRAAEEWAEALDLDELLGDGDHEQARATVARWRAIEHADERDRVIRESLSVALDGDIPEILDVEEPINYGGPRPRDLALEAVETRLLHTFGPGLDSAPGGA